jgi:hypothetical protein
MPRKTDHKDQISEKTWLIDERTRSQTQQGTRAEQPSLPRRQILRQAPGLGGGSPETHNQESCAPVARGTVDDIKYRHQQGEWTQNAASRDLYDGS